MRELQGEIEEHIDAFIDRVSRLAQHAAINTLTAAFGGSSRAEGSVGSGKPGRPRGHRVAKRTQANLEELSQHFLEFVRGNPGLRIEQINKQLGTTTKDLALPIRKLVAEKVISRKGEKRSTTYFAKAGLRPKRTGDMQ